MKKFYVLACALALFAALPGAQGKRFITEKDLFKFTWIADPQISPDGATVAFVRVTVSEKDNRYETALWVILYSGIVTFVLLKLVGLVIPLRHPDAVLEVGDHAIHGHEVYPADVATLGSFGGAPLQPAGPSTQTAAPA